MAEKNDDKLAHILFGDEGSIVGSARMIVLILIFIVVFGTFFWLLGRLPL
jgi:hypothetical protein